jgi:hypothetical protein
MKKTLLSLPLAITLAACANLESPIEPGYAGPTVVVNDTQLPEGNTRAQFFVIEEVDGRRVNNALIESRRASNGGGFTLVGRNISRELPSRPLRLKLLATEETGAPIEAIFRAATGSLARSVEGIVEFVPQEGHQYIVTGEMSKETSSVWIQDLSANQPASEKIASRESSTTQAGTLSQGHPRQRPAGVECDKWGNPKDEDGHPCHE